MPIADATAQFVGSLADLAGDDLAKLNPRVGTITPCWRLDGIVGP